MNLKDVNNFKTAIKNVVSAFESKEKFLIGPLVVRLSKAIEENPGDQTIIGLASYLQRKSNKDTFISRADLQDVYGKFYVTNSNCAGYLERELGKQAEMPEPKKMVRAENEGSLVENVYAKADQGLVNALGSVFDKSATYTPYSQKMVKMAVDSCAREINSLNVKPSSIEVVAGSEDCMLCRASFETPKGKTHLLVPVEIVENKALLPTVFVSQAGFENLNEDTVKAHIIRTAGKQFTVNVAAILNVIKTAKHGPAQEELNEVERIVMKANAAKETPANFDSNGILYQQVDPANSNVEVKNSPEAETFAARLGSVAGLAEMTFGKSAVNAGRNMIKKAMDSFGYNNSQVSVADVSADYVCYAVAVSQGAGLKVPVKFANELPIEPDYALANGQVNTFDEEGVQKLLTVNDHSTAALASQLHGVKSSELIETIKESMSEGNLLRAEDALNVLANSNDKKAYDYGFAIYRTALTNKDAFVKNASVSKCDRQIKNGTSQYVLCGHTGLPLHKVYQNEHGECLPEYRKHIDHTGEGGSFLHSRVYFG